MKSLLKYMFVKISVCVLIVVLSASTFAAGTVTYDGNSKKFIFEPGSKHSPTDLFADFKDAMPGDSITQRILVKNDVSNNVKIKLYIKSLGAKDESKDFLSKLNIKVNQNGDSVLFDASADKSAQLTEWVCIGTFYSGAEIDLNVTLDIPIELDNEYQNSVGYIDWKFKVEELPVDPDDPKPPITGDNSDIISYTILGAISAIVLAILFIIVFRKKKEY